MNRLLMLLLVVFSLENACSSEISSSVELSENTRVVIGDLYSELIYPARKIIEGFYPELERHDERMRIYGTWSIPEIEEIISNISGKCKFLINSEPTKLDHIESLYIAVMFSREVLNVEGWRESAVLEHSSDLSDYDAVIKVQEISKTHSDELWKFLYANYPDHPVIDSLQTKIRRFLPGFGLD